LRSPCKSSTACWRAFSAFDLGLQVGDLLDLDVEFRVGALEHLVALVLGGDLAGVVAADHQHQGRAEQAAQGQQGREGGLLLLAFGFPVGKQVNPDHQPNLRSARPQATR
jgi:hypothetical protein